jgi:hypothetical protein
MTIRKRLERVERAVGMSFPNGRCSHCRGWPAKQVRVENALGVVHQQPELTCCPQCGWTPQILVFTKVIVGSTEDIEANQGRGG